MVDRIEFEESQAVKLVLAAMAFAVAGLWVFRFFPTGVPTLSREVVVLLVANMALFGLGVICLWRLRRTGVVVVVDRNGFTDLRVMPEPFPWTDVERCKLAFSTMAGRALVLIPRPDSQTAARLGKRKFIVNERILKKRELSVRDAITRMAPHVRREWS